MSSFPPRLFRSFISLPPLPPTKCYPETLVFHRRLTSHPPALAPRALKSPGANYITWLGQDGWNRAQSSVCLRRNSSCLRACSPSDVNVNKTSLSSFMNFERTLFFGLYFFLFAFFSSSSPGILRREMEDLHYRGHYTSLMVHSLPGCHLTPYKIIIKACPREPGQTAIPPRQNIDSIWMWTLKAAKKRRSANCWKEGKDTPCFQRGVQLVLDLW